MSHIVYIDRPSGELERGTAVSWCVPCKLHSRRLCIHMRAPSSIIHLGLTVRATAWPRQATTYIMDVNSESAHDNSAILVKTCSQPIR